MDSGTPKRNNSDFNKIVQYDEGIFNDIGINQNIGNLNEKQDDINISGISQINNPITDSIQNKQEKENNITKGKTKTKNVLTISTKSKTFPTRREITDKLCKTTTLLDLFIENKTFKQLVDKKEEEIRKEEDNNEIIKVNDNEIEIEEQKNIKKEKDNIIDRNKIEEENKNEIKENNNNELKNSYSSEEKEKDMVQLNEEEEKFKKEKALVIEKILKKTDELVDIPNFNIFDDSKMKEFLNEDDDYVIEEKK